MTVVFRCDASPSIGAGHVTRCRALALALRSRGVESVFATTSPAYFEGFETVAPDALPARVERDVVVDHYDYTADDFARFRDGAFRLGVIDDRADRDLTAADWVLNQNLSAQRLDYRVRDDALVLRGPRYALLRPEFAPAHDRLARTFSPADDRVLVTLGGGARAAECARVVEALKSVDRELSIRCVAVDDAPELTEAAARSRHAVAITGAVADMTEHLLWADVSVNAGGSTSWELLCLGLPMVVLSLAGDQGPNVAALRDEGVAVAADGLDDVAGAVDGLLADPAERERLSRQGAELVDGRGAERVAAQALAVS